MYLCMFCSPNSLFQYRFRFGSVSAQTRTGTEPTGKHRSLAWLYLSLCCCADGLKGMVLYLFLLLLSSFTVWKCDRGINSWNHLFLVHCCSFAFTHIHSQLSLFLINLQSRFYKGQLVFCAFCYPPQSSAVLKLNLSCLCFVPPVTASHCEARTVDSHVWLLLLVNCLFVGESLILWATQCVWTGTPPGIHTTSGSLKVLWHRWHPFFSDTKIGFFRSFNWG